MKNLEEAFRKERQTYSRIPTSVYRIDHAKRRIVFDQMKVRNQFEQNWFQMYLDKRVITPERGSHYAFYKGSKKNFHFLHSLAAWLYIQLVKDGKI